MVSRSRSTWCYRNADRDAEYFAVAQIAGGAATLGTAPAQALAVDAAPERTIRVGIDLAQQLEKTARRGQRAVTTPSLRALTPAMRERRESGDGARSTASAGALRAAHFVAARRAAGQAGLADMRDVLGLR